MQRAARPVSRVHQLRASRSVVPFVSLLVLALVWQGCSCNHASTTAGPILTVSVTWDGGPFNQLQFFGWVNWDGGSLAMFADGGSDYPSTATGPLDSGSSIEILLPKIASGGMATVSVNALSNGTIGANGSGSTSLADTRNSLSIFLGSGCVGGCAGNQSGSACVNATCGCNSESDCQPQQACNLTLNECSQTCLSDGGSFSPCLDGCCGHVDGLCRPGDYDTACGSSSQCRDCTRGSAGQLCLLFDAGYDCGCALPTDCPPGLACGKAGTCVQDCGAQQLCNGGCCDFTQTPHRCQPGTSSSQCGSNGAMCQDCGSATCSDAGVCSGCSTTCAGCCSGSTCTSPPTLQNCGTGGGACTSCNPQLSDNCNAGFCECGLGGSCSGDGGVFCDGGICVCDLSTCNGCCDPVSGSCQPGTSPTACGPSGQNCTSCAPPTQCLRGKCVGIGTPDAGATVDAGFMDAGNNLDSGCGGVGIGLCSCSGGAFPCSSASCCSTECNGSTCCQPNQSSCPAGCTPTHACPDCCGGGCGFGGNCCQAPGTQCPCEDSLQCPACCGGECGSNGLCCLPLGEKCLPTCPPVGMCPSCCSSQCGGDGGTCCAPTLTAPCPCVAGITNGNGPCSLCCSGSCSLDACL
jgi:hypothetical protein